MVVCLCDGEFLLIDGFKRLTAACSIKGFETLRARAMECDERSAKAAMYNLNRVGRGVQEIEEAWIVHSLVREDGLSQVEAAELLSPTRARHLVRLPVGNHAEALDVARRDLLSSQEFQGVTNLLLASGTPAKKALVLQECFPGFNPDTQNEDKTR